MDTVQLVALIVAAVFGVIAVIEANGKSWAGWGVLLLALVLLATEVQKVVK